MPERHAVGEAGDRGPVAPSRLSALLALALKVWTAVSRSRELIRQMNRANPPWGAPRDPRRAKLKLGIQVSQATVAKYMVRRVGTPSPTWRSFLRNEAIGIAAIDMFVAVSASFRLLYVMIILAHGRRRIVRFDVTPHPTAVRLSPQVIEAFPWDTARSFLLRDRDASYGSVFSKRVAAMGVTEVVTAPRSPGQNPHVERVIGSIRRECLDHVVIFNERHLRRVLSSYVDYYQRTRTHLSLDKDCPDPRPIQPRRIARVVPVPQVGGRIIATNGLPPDSYRLPVTDGCSAAGTPSSDDPCVRGCSISTQRRPF